MALCKIKKIIDRNLVFSQIRFDVSDAQNVHYRYAVCVQLHLIIIQRCVWVLLQTYVAQNKIYFYARLKVRKTPPSL